MADDQRDEGDEIEELKALMQKNAEALERLRTMLDNLEVLLGTKKPHDPGVADK